MPLSPDKQEALKQATIEYLRTLTLIHIWDQRDPNVNINHQKHCVQHLFTSSAKEGPHGLFAPMEAWEKYLARVGEIADSRVQRAFIGQKIDVLYRQVATLPIEDAQIESFAEQIIEWCNQAFDFLVTAYVPLVNIEISRDIDPLFLADTQLHRGSEESEFAHYLSMLSVALKFDVPPNLPFLKMTVTGDDESIEDQVAAKTDDALRALRFVCETNSTINGTRRISYCEARDVSRYPTTTPKGHFLFVNPTERVFNRYQTNRTSQVTLHIDHNKLKKFNESGLEGINQHFASETHPISAHLLLALQWYDSGLQAVRKRDALYRFVVCVNGILSWDTNAISNSKELCRRYKKLLTATAIIETDSAHLDLIGTLSTKQHEFEETVTLEESVKVIAEDYATVFKDLYDKQRGSILHGHASNPSNRFPLTDTNVDDARLLAQNALRLTMKMLDAHIEWQTRDTIETWFSATQINGDLNV
jgi:hypothetical protein